MNIFETLRCRLFQLDPKAYVDTCLYLYCSLPPKERNVAVCDTLASYARECAQQHVIITWRTAGLCGAATIEGFLVQISKDQKEKKKTTTTVLSASFTISAGRVCPRGQVFSDCVSSCPPTCSSPNTLGPASAMGQCREECVGGCECPPGLYLHQGRCLKRDDCPCFHRRRTYESGDRIEQRCNNWYGSFSCYMCLLQICH